MKILVAHKFYRRGGGPEKLINSIEKILTRDGHISVPFSMKGEYNKNSPYYDFFIKNVDYTGQEPSNGFFSKLKIAANLIYSTEAKYKIKKLINQENPDIAHIHNIYHQISPSILPVLKEKKIPIVQTLHDWKLICPSYRLYVKDKICEKCKNNQFYNSVLQRCIKNSLPSSLLNCIEMYIHKYMRIYEDNVDIFICPSNFIRDKMIEFGLNSRKMAVIPTGIDINNFQPIYLNSGYFIYFGRLEKEKGIFTLLEAMRKVKKSSLWIIGGGLLEEKIKNIIKNNNLNNVKFLGFVDEGKLSEIVQNAMFSIIPSEWYENASSAVVEAMAYGKPVIGSRIGGIPEQIEDGVNGFLFTPGDKDELANKINYLISNPELAISMGKSAREKVENKYTISIYYSKLMEIYNKAIEENKKRWKA